MGQLSRGDARLTTTRGRDSMRACALCLATVAGGGGAAAIRWGMVRGSDLYDKLYRTSSEIKGIDRIAEWPRVRGGGWLTVECISRRGGHQHAVTLDKTDNASERRSDL